MCPFAQTICRTQFPLLSWISLSVSGPCSVTNVSRSPYLHASSRSSLTSSVRDEGAGMKFSEVHFMKSWVQPLNISIFLCLLFKICIQRLRRWKNRAKHSLEIRTVAAAVYKVTKILVHGCLLIDSNTLQNFVRKEENRQVIFEATLPHGTSGMSLQTLNHISPPRPTPLRHALASPPNTITTLDSENVISTRLTTLLFAHLRSSSRAKASARLVVPGTQLNIFFVPAHGAPLQSTPVDEPEDDEALTSDAQRKPVAVVTFPFQN